MDEIETIVIIYSKMKVKVDQEGDGKKQCKIALRLLYQGLWGECCK